VDPVHRCPHCGHGFQGWAAYCPACDRDLPLDMAAPHARQALPPPRNLSPVAWATATGVGILTAGLLFFALLVVALGRYFCLDFGGTGACTAQEAESQRFFWLVMVPLPLATGALAAALVVAALRRRRRRTN
jgi:hypothetical protein